MRTSCKTGRACRGSVALTLMVVGLSILPVHAAVLRVNAASTTPTPDGLSWGSAFSALQPAVDAAASGDVLWVAAGTYTGNDFAVLTLKDGITLYGGFKGVESDRAQRDWKANKTIIDGQHLRRCVHTPGEGTVDGFTLQNGFSLDFAGGMWHGTAVNCAFIGNSVQDQYDYDGGMGYNAHGGGMFDGTAINCIFSGNSAQAGYRSDCALGGGMYGGTATDCSFSGNAAYAGGGMYAGTAVNCSFSENHADKWAGGMFLGKAERCTFSKNTAGGGGAMFNGEAVNCVFTQNSARQNGGGGMYAGSAVNCTFAENSAQYSGGGMVEGTALNCILWGNIPDETQRTSVSHSCLSVATAGMGNIAANPCYVNPRANDYRLRADSPCMDAGAAEGSPATDILDRARPQGAGVDMGAYEYHLGDDEHAVIAPTRLRVNAASTATAPDGLSWETAFSTLQTAADRAGYGTEIWVVQGVYTATTGDEVIRLTVGTSVYGGFTGTETTRDARSLDASTTVIDGQHVRRCVTAFAVNAVDGFTLQNGTAPHGAGMYGGAAVNCTFIANAATYDGGGMCGTATNCIFHDNSAGDNGGGMRGTATNCIVYENSAYGAGGIEGSAVNCTVVANTGLGVNGTATNCILWGNNPGDFAGFLGGASPSYSCLSAVAPGGEPGEGNIVADPLFVNAAAGDFRLQPGSPCIDMGTGTGAPATDILGVPRPQGRNYDMGAYESVVPMAVPNVTGLVQTSAHQLLIAAGLYLGKETEEYDPVIPADSVLRQNPAAGEQVPQRTAVDLTVSKGLHPPVQVPNVVGQTLDEAAARAAAAGLLIGTTTQQYSLDVPAGTVMAQTPAAGTEAAYGSAVCLVVSKGGIAMPNVVGRPEAEALSAVTDAGLAVGLITKVHSDTAAAGLVVSQNPSPGTELPPGTAVNIVVSLGPAPAVEGEVEPVNAASVRSQLAADYLEADTNHDGQLSYREAAALVTGLTQSVFDALDTNTDGQLTQDELEPEGAPGCTGWKGMRKHSLEDTIALLFGLLDLAGMAGDTL